ncbi:MAG TPA: efflux RND transporter periplasmic adaptor subunit [Steroidobacter sp.]|uniref:efflux RND transporter periplasmic adaptor subunit n=1 Tax=Steroidobacter sp. TaxID=1978227 RepID=UPI002ED92264
MSLRRKRYVVILALAAVALVTGLRMTSSRGDVSDKEAEPVALTISVAAVKRESWAQTVTLSGAVTPWQESVVGAPLSGLRLASIEVDVGDVVRKGQVLARFDDALLRADVNRLSARLSQAEAQAVQATRDAQRAESLRPSGALSEQSVLASITQAEVAAAMVKSARAELNAKQVELSYAVLRASDDGVISERTATVGAVVASGEALFRLIRQQRLEWRGEASAEQLKGIGKGQSVELMLPDGTKAAATIRQAAPTLSADSRMALVYADIHPGSNARAGMYAAGKIGLATTAALVVPSSSIVVRDGRSYAFVVARQGDTARVTAHAVKVGRRQEHFVEVVSGLAEGVDIAESGAGFLSDGDRVRIVKPLERYSASKQTQPVADTDAGR